MQCRSWALILVLSFGFFFGCAKDLAQVFFHPSVETRFSDSTAGNLPVPAPINVNTSAFNFAVFGDVHLQLNGTNRLTRFKQDVIPKGIDFFVVLGDLTDDGTNGEYGLVSDALRATGIPYYAVMGNHDLLQGGNNGGWETWKSTFGPSTYSVTMANLARFIFLDTASGDIGASQFNYLQNQLATSVPYTFVASHYGIFEGIQPPLFRLERVEERYKLSSLLNKFNVYAYLSGHLHAYKHTKVGNVEHFTVGSMYPYDLDFGPHGYLLFSYANGQMTYQQVSID